MNPTPPYDKPRTFKFQDTSLLYGVVVDTFLIPALSWPNREPTYNRLTGTPLTILVVVVDTGDEKVQLFANHSLQQQIEIELARGHRDSLEPGMEIYVHRLPPLKLTTPYCWDVYIKCNR